MPDTDLPAEASVADGAAESAAGEEAGNYRLRDLVDEVAGATGLRRRDARLAAEAVLAAIGAAIDRHEVLALPPLGRLRYGGAQRSAESQVVVLKLRRSDRAAAETAAEDAGEDNPASGA